MYEVNISWTNKDQFHHTHFTWYKINDQTHKALLFYDNDYINIKIFDIDHFDVASNTGCRDVIKSLIFN